MCLDRRDRFGRALMCPIDLDGAGDEPSDNLEEGFIAFVKGGDLRTLDRHDTDELALDDGRRGELAPGLRLYLELATTFNL